MWDNTAFSFTRHSHSRGILIRKKESDLQIVFKSFSSRLFLELYLRDRNSAQRKLTDAQRTIALVHWLFAFGANKRNVFLNLLH